MSLSIVQATADAPNITFDEWVDTSFKQTTALAIRGEYNVQSLYGKALFKATLDVYGQWATKKKKNQENHYQLIAEVKVKVSFFLLFIY